MLVDTQRKKMGTQCSNVCIHPSTHRFHLSVLWLVIIGAADSSSYASIRRGDHMKKPGKHAMPNCHYTGLGRNSCEYPGLADI
jgi:hypothetical protein